MLIRLFVDFLWHYSHHLIFFLFVFERLDQAPRIQALGTSSAPLDFGFSFPFTRRRAGPMNPFSSFGPQRLFLNKFIRLLSLPTFKAQFSLTTLILF